MKDKLKDIRFNLTKKTHDYLIELLVVEQMIREKKYESDFELNLLLQHKKILTDEYIKEFRANNKKQIKQYKDMMNC